MCIIAVMNPGVALPTDEELRNCWEQNPHRAGFMYVLDGVVTIEKYAKLKEFMFALKERHAFLGKDSPFVFHMRYATHGDVNEANTHPFYVSDDVAFCHNGVIRKHQSAATKEISDTRVFNEKVLSKLPTNFFFNAGVGELLADYIGLSKLAFMDSDKRVSIINCTLGEWHKDIWFSNDYYKSKRKKTYTTTNPTRGPQRSFHPYYGYGGWEDAWGGYKEEDYTDTDDSETSKCENCGSRRFFHMDVYFTHDGWDDFARVPMCTVCYRKFRDDHNYNVNASEMVCELCKVDISNIDDPPRLFDLDDTSCNIPICEYCVGEMATTIIEASDTQIALRKLSELAYEEV